MSKEGRKAIWLDPHERDLARTVFRFLIDAVSERIGYTLASETDVFALKYTKKELQALLLKFEEVNKNALEQDEQER